MKVLIVEDEHRIANTLKKGLEQEKHIVDIAYDGATGLDLALNEEYDVITLDLLLPEKDGMTVCKELREQGVHTPILMLTAKGQINERVSGLDAGADDYLTKPFSFDELLARLRALGRRKKQKIENRFSIDTLTLDTVARTVTREEKVIRLTSKEYAVLEFLLRHQGSIVSKEQIMRYVWDYDADVLPNTIEVYIRNLRNKIDIPFSKSKQLIHTVRGFGYKISV